MIAIEKLFTQNFTINFWLQKKRKRDVRNGQESFCKENTWGEAQKKVNFDDDKDDDDGGGGGGDNEDKEDIQVIVYDNNDDDDNNISMTCFIILKLEQVSRN